MFKHILVPTDLTERSVQALGIAVRMAYFHEDAGKITLLHVIETIEDTGYDQFEEFYTKLRKRARKRMERMLSPYEDQKPKISQEIMLGKRVGEIIRYAYENQVDLIVLSSHKISPEKDLEGWGTISYKVGILSPCPVMLVK